MVLETRITIKLPKEKFEVDMKILLIDMFINNGQILHTPINGKNQIIAIT